MPEYTYACGACGHTESQWRHVYTDGDINPPRCPKCEIPMTRQYIGGGMTF